MKIPEGLNDYVNKRKFVCKLNKSLYGLKQAFVCWNSVFEMYTAEYGFVSSSAESSIYVGKMNDRIVYIVLFVDDGLIITKDCIVLRNAIKMLRERFEITECKPEIFVGLNIVRDHECRVMF